MVLQHDLGREEVRRRLRERSHEIADHIPDAMATVDTNWPHEDEMQMAVNAMGQQVRGAVQIADDNVVLDFALPAALSFFEPMIEKALAKGGQKLLAKPD